MMKRKTTRDLLSLGMALYADRSTMEQRIHGIFSKRSSKAATAFAVLIAVFLTVGCFTTACRPVTAERAAQLPSVTPEPEMISAVGKAPTKPISALSEPITPFSMSCFSFMPAATPLTYRPW